MMRIVHNPRRSRTGCSILALATVLAVGASPAAAQSFQGTGTFSSGTGVITPSGNTTAISVTSPTAVINWTPTDNAANPNVPIVFQPGGTFADYSGAGNYAVLNRINVADNSRVVELHGTIRTVANGALNGTGSLYFYSPSGFLLGGSSVINVPSLVLSALPIMADGNGSFIVGADRTVTFSGAPVNPNASITTMPGSQITANMTGSYVALVAPRVAHHGTITTNGQAALVAAEVATINFSPDGLFDISVTTGTADPNGIALHGDINGEASTGAGDNNRIYAVAVPKNDILTMVIGSGADLGFAIAGAANVDGNAIVLSAGHNVTDGVVNAQPTSAASEAAMVINAPRATSAVTAVASGNLHLFANPGEISTFASNVTLRGDDQVWANASGAGSLLSIAGNLSLSANATGAAGEAVTAGEAKLYALNSGVVTVTGSTTLTAIGTGTSGGNATGGQVHVDADDGGQLTVNALTLNANGIGGSTASGTGGSGTGGYIRVSSTSDSTLNVNGALQANALGTGGSGTVSGASGGDGSGGEIWMYAADAGSELNLDSITANATGGGGSIACIECTGSGGTGYGGEVRLYADTGAAVIVDSYADLYAIGGGGAAGGTGVAGDGYGGVASAYVGNDATLTVNGGGHLFADGSGGYQMSGTGTGGDGFGGSARLTGVAGSTGGGVLTFGNNSALSATGNGGTSYEGTGGEGYGGYASIFSNGTHHFVVTGALDVRAYGSGGFDSVIGGNGYGGTAEIRALAPEVDITGTVELDAHGQGGSGTSAGGDGYGGDSNIISGNDVSFNNLAYLYAYGLGGDSLNGNGGYGEGGTIEVRADGGHIQMGSLIANASAQGGTAYAEGSSSGDGQGGDIDIRTYANSSMVMANLTAEATGIGGYVWSSADGGNGRGGTIEMIADGSASIFDVNFQVNLNADGIAGFTPEGTSGRLGGMGEGGDIDIGSDNGALLTIDGSLDAEARGIGGVGIDADGGFGEGGSVQLSAGNGGRLDVGGLAKLSVEGGGGERVASESGGDADAVAGDGQGGFVEVFTWGSAGSDLNLLGGVTLNANGYGGDNDVQGVAAFAGSGTGGTAWFDAQVGTIDVTGNVILTAIGIGGDAAYGTGGSGTGKNAEIDGIGGVVTISGTALVDAGGQGGDGQVAGGAGTGGGEVTEDGQFIDGAHIFAQNGSVTINGVTTVTASGTGGDGLAGDFSMVGGTGGDGTAGVAAVIAANSNGGHSNINLSTLNINANGTGGAGGQGGSGNLGGNGGAGGNAAGGGAYVYANAGNGHVTITSVNANALATGGEGGDGGNGDNEAGGNGGAGGNAEGGSVSIGTASGNNQVPNTNLGTATYGTIIANASATGGRGGAGNFGGVNGVGGNGGTGDGGAATVLVRGSTVTVTNSAQLIANGTGGDGGSGGGETGAAGNGADGYAGEVSIIASSRYLHPDQHATLNIASISGTAAGVGGTGLVDGGSIVEGGSGIQLDSSTAHIGTLNFAVTGDSVDPGADPSYIYITNSTIDDVFTIDNEQVDVASSFAFSTAGDLFVHVDNGSLTTDALTLNAGDFVTIDEVDPPANRGTIYAGTASISTGNNFIAEADFDVGGNLSIIAPGMIDAHDFTTGGDLALEAAGGGIDVGVLDSGGDIDLDAAGNILFTSASAGSDFDFFSGGSVTGGNVTATNEISGHAGGAVSLGNLTAGLPNEDDVSVGISAVGNIGVGNVSGAGPVGFATQGNLVTGTINAGDFFLAMVGGNTTTGAITTTGESGGQVYIADDSMFLTGGGTWDDQGDFDPSVVFALDPVRTGGAITINGAINTGLFQVAAGTSLTTGAINSGGGIGLDANGSITTGNLVAGDFVLANGGSITTGSIDASSVAMESTGGNITIGGDVTASGEVELDAFGNIQTDNITAGTINLAAGGSITTDNLTTELPLVLAAAFDGVPEVDPEGEGNIILIAGGNILTGDITAAESILLVTPGTITGQTIEAGNVFMALAHGDMSFGDATAVEVFLADFAMYSAEGGEGPVGAICIGSCGTLGADGVVTAPPSGSTYTYVTTAGGPSGAGQLPGEGGTNGSDYTTSQFSAAAGDDLEFWFNYVTSDGAGFADYAWASLLTSSLDPVAILFTARTQASGTIVPGFDLPGVEATLTPASVPIIDGGPVWSPLGAESGACFSAGCGYTGWINSTYEIAEAGNYVVRFGVTNWSDGGYASGMAFSGITVGGVPVESGLTPTGGSITIGNVNAVKMTAAAGTTLTTGIIDVSDFANLVSGGNMVTGAVTATNNLWADAGGTMTLGALSGGDIELASGGNMSFVSANAGTEFDFSSDASVNGGNVTAGAHISGEAGGTVAINGTWSAPDVNITSNDINITESGSINAGSVQLYSTNATQTVVGDGVGGGGYQLSNAEFNRINANGEIEVGAWMGGGAADRMMFGDLTYTDDSEGGIEIEFAVFEDDSETGDGSMRVVGDMTFNGMSGDDSVQFTTGLFELDAATGSVALYSNGTTLGGELQIQSPHIRVASGQILDQLAENPTYSGYQQDLNKPADVQRPDGVVKAASISLDLTDMGDSATIYVQNTGTAATPAGFLVTDEIFVGEDGELGAPAGSINLIINGQLITEGGTLTGIAVRDEMVAQQGDITPFTANSTINGCPLTGACIIKPEEPPPNPDVIDDQIDLITNNPLGDGAFGNEDSIDDNEEGDEGADNPISAPQPLFDTRPLVPTGDVSDPVSGTGNPALVGSGTECDESEEGQCPAEQTDGEGE